MREKVLLGGATGTSKTMSLVQLAMLYPDSKVVILDPDDGVEKVVAELGFDSWVKLTPDAVLGDRNNLPSLTVIPVTPDWDALIKLYKAVKAVLLPQDWMCLDMMNRFWDFAQNYYSRMVFGKTPSEYLMMLRNQAKAVSFGGFDGLTDWTIIKRMHNEELVDDALLWSQFNVMATTSISSYLPVEKIPKAGIEGVLATSFGIKLEGEKHNLYRFDTVAVMVKKANGHFYFRLAKDKGRNIDLTQEFDVTGSNFWAKYCEYRGIEL